jgi:hypothetical protein
VDNEVDFSIAEMMLNIRQKDNAKSI